MDASDEEILRALRTDAKAKLKPLARKLGMPLSTVYARVKRLEHEGLIKHYSVEIDWKKLGYGVKAFVLVYVDTTKLKELHKSQYEIIKQLRAFPFVDEAEIVTGDAEMLIKIRAKDTSDMGRLLTEKVQSITGITKTKTLVALE